MIQAQFHRFSILPLVALALCGSAIAGEKAGRPPNVVFILADDLGYGDLGCYGQKLIQTPNLDRMAREGLRFRQFYAGSTVCAPSRCVLMTGRHTGHCTVRGNALVPLRPDDLTVAEVLHTRGYATALIGKWGLGEPGSTGIPTRKGFDEFFGYLNQQHAHNYYPDYLWRNETRAKLENELSSVSGVSSVRRQYAPDLITAEALSFLDRRHKEPFFLCLTCIQPHANNERGRAEGNGMETPGDAPYSDRNWPQPQKNHAAMITALDRDVGRVLQKIRDLGIDEETIVFFSSDNGPHQEGGADPKFFSSSGPLRGIKRDLTEGGIRVPLIVRGPGRVAAGKECDAVCWFADFLPTAAALAGGAAPEGLDGVSIAPLLNNPSASLTDRHLYWEFHERGFQQAVRLNNWKGIRLKPGRPIELYDLASDPGEQRNIASDHPAVVEQLERLMATSRTDSAEFPVKSQP